ncbi:MAG: ribulose-phosphate 3-epimerase, partial [Firmicutes bacterium]|nr:ribulose-phosphate 3-epimerase [Bacillota bacterium]
MARRIMIAPSVICADLGALRDDIIKLESAGCDVLHFDIMDGDFIGTFAFGPDTISSVRGCTRLPFEVHLLTERPERFIGPDTILRPIEACSDPTAAVAAVAKRAKAGLAFYPPTPAEAVIPLLDSIEVCTVMTMERAYPFRGRPFAY